jgi:Mrp family chromosome partitioning ATPase
MLGIDTEVGLAEAVSQGLPASLASVTLRPTGLDVLPMREQVDNSAELLTAGSFHNLIQTLDSAYDFILFDSPPLFAGGDSAFLVRLTDATLLVVCPGKTNVAQLEKAVAPLSKENIVGVVINRTAQA